MSVGPLMINWNDFGDPHFGDFHLAPWSGQKFNLLNTLVYVFPAVPEF